jgi:hypothetical protein
MKFLSFAGNDKVTNVIFFVSILNILGFIFMHNFDAVIAFVVFGMLAAYFSQDMKIILGVPLVIVNFIYVLRHRGIFEGMENNDESSNKNSPNESDAQDAEKTVAEKKNAHVTSNDGSTLPEPKEEPFSGGNGKKNAFRIDYATSLTNQYKDLNKILGSANIQQLTKDSKDLLNQQQQLTKAMEGMAPLVGKLVPIMESMGGFMNGTGVGGAGAAQVAKMMNQMGNKSK